MYLEGHRNTFTPELSSTHARGTHSYVIWMETYLTGVNRSRLNRSRLELDHSLTSCVSPMVHRNGSRFIMRMHGFVVRE